MQVRPLEVVLALLIAVVMAFSLREGARSQLRQSRIAASAAALDALVTARAATVPSAGYRRTTADAERDRAIERPLITAGAGHLRAGRVREAIAVFEMTVEAVPRSWTAWHALGAAYESAGDRRRAVAAYATSVALNPRNDKGRQALDRLQGR